MAGRARRLRRRADRRQSARAADPAPAATEPAERRRESSTALGRAALGVALVVGAALLFLYFNDALAPARDVLLPIVVVLVAGTLILTPWWIRLVRGLADERASACARRSAPSWPRTCTTRCCRRWR